MTNRERFISMLRFEPVDRAVIVPGGPWRTTRNRWEQEGLPPAADIHEVLGIERVGMALVPIATEVFPPFKEEILEETDEWVIKIDRRGVKVRELRGEVSMPEHLEYPLKGTGDMDFIRARLDPDALGRVTPDWLAIVQRDQAEGKIVLANGGSYFGLLNERMGTERLMTCYYDAPDFIHAINDHVCSTCEQALEMLMPEFQLDYLGYHEDMAYRNGPMISPAMFKQFMTPYYQRIRAVMERHYTPVTLMDSDGDIRALIPLWIECGITGFLPMEVAAGMDVVELRREYGQTICMKGGFDKRILASNRAAIRTEIERLRPVIEGGGYICSCDHGVPSDVPWENYRYFVECLKVVHGLA